MYSKESVTSQVQSIQGHLHARRGRWKTHRLRAWQHRLTNVESDLPATCAARRRPVRGVVTKFGGDPETQRRPAHMGAWRNRPPDPLAWQVRAVAVRTHSSALQLGRSLAVLADAARQNGDPDLATQSDAERATIVARVGPEVGGLVWERNVVGARRRLPPRSRRSAIAWTESPLARELALNGIEPGREVPGQPGTCRETGISRG